MKIAASNSPNARPLWTVDLDPDTAKMFDEAASLLMESESITELEARSKIANECVRQHLEMLSDCGEIQTFHRIVSTPCRGRKVHGGSRGGAR